MTGAASRSKVNNSGSWLKHWLKFMNVDVRGVASVKVFECTNLCSCQLLLSRLGLVSGLSEIKSRVFVLIYCIKIR